MTAIVDEIFGLFERHGSEGYGEDLSLERHMLQAAARARTLGASDSVVCAALLHDIGYFLHASTGAHTDAGIDFGHEAIGAAWLSQSFGPEVTAPIAMHVRAKQYLCAVEAGYLEDLSEASRISLAAQGGVMTPAQAAAFEQGPAFEAALLLRRCDDQGKEVSADVRPLASYRPLLRACLR